MRVPESRLRRQGRLLERYWMQLRRDRPAEPPAELEPHLAELAERLETNLQAPGPSTAFADQLQRRIEASVPDTTRRGWSGPAIERRPLRQPTQTSTTEPVKDEEYLVSTSTGEPVQLPRRRLSQEWLKIAAAILVFVIVGAGLVLLLRDDDDDSSNLGNPGDATPTAAATATEVAPTATNQAAVIPTAPPSATATEAPALPEAFRVESTLDTEGREIMHVVLQLTEWAAFGGSEENAVTDAVNLTYQDTGIESCWYGDASIALHHPDSTTEQMTNDITNPNIVSAGDYFAVGSSVGNNCKNNGRTKSRSFSGVLFFAEPQPIIGAPASVRVANLAVGTVQPFTGSANVVLERLWLNPGETLERDPNALTAVYVESGELGLSAVDAAVPVTRSAGERTEDIAAGETTMLAATDGAVLATGSGSTVIPSVSVPVSLIVLTVVPGP